MNENIPLSPIEWFDSWYQEALTRDAREPSWMTLATSTSDGVPSARIVLLKMYDDSGFCFYTNLTSRKGKELQENPNAALCFYWDSLARQVRIEGKVKKVSGREADKYFSSRKRGSQLGAWSSKQSHVMEHENALVERVSEITGQFEGQTVPRPPFWSGFRLVPSVIEFWEEGEFRLHKRTRYTKVHNGWQADCLYP